MEYQFVFNGALYIFYNQNILFSAFSHLHIPSIQLEKLEQIQKIFQQNYSSPLVNVTWIFLEYHPKITFLEVTK